MKLAALRLLRWGRLVFACGALLLGAACMDSYPREDEIILNPFNMTQTQRLVAMNKIGEDAHLQRNWNYDLLPGCVLRIDIDADLGSRPVFDVPLSGSVIEVARDRVSNTFNVTVTQHGDSAQASESVLESEDWAMASRTQLLLKVLERGCSDAVGNTVSKLAVFQRQSAP